MAEETFTCERCGQQFPRNQLKEVFYEEGPGKERRKIEVDPSCLDEIMNESDQVRGVAGEEKRAAVRVDEEGIESSGTGSSGGGSDGAERESFGQRG